jgi:hypothetical protein
MNEGEENEEEEDEKMEDIMEGIQISGVLFVCVHISYYMYIQL